MNLIVNKSKGQIIAIAGKTIRREKWKDQKSPFHMISAWTSENNMVLAQVRTSEKPKEITVMPELIEALDIEEAIITINAMEIQIDIAAIAS